MIDSHDYDIDLVTSGPRTGRLTSPSSELPALTVAPPPQFDGPTGEWSPEHLFVAALSSS